MVQLLTAVACCSFSACDTAVPVKEKEAVKKEFAAAPNDSVRVQTSITGFLKWYKLNYKQANGFPLLTKDPAGNFSLNKKAYTGYLAFLSNSHLISSRYIGYWETFFTDKEAELKRNKIKSDIPEGFDLDLVLITQEPELILNKIDSIRFNIASMNDSVALVGLRLPSDSLMQYEVEMYKTKDTWQIGYISTPNYD